jgi:hypothetical protein
MTKQPRTTKRVRRLIPIAAAGMAMAGLAVIPLLASAGPGVKLPDLVADTPERISSPQIANEPQLPGNRLIIRFDGFVTNVGAGALRLKGNPQNPGGVRQMVAPSSGGDETIALGAPEVRFEYADSHNHFHFMRAMRYSIWNDERTAEVAPASKVGFCVYNSETVPGHQTVTSGNPQGATRWIVGAPGDTFCQSANPGEGGLGPTATSLDMGIDPGFRDLYDQSLAFQWVDVSNVAPGVYWVAAQADPDNQIQETNENNNGITFGDVPVTIPGYAPRAIGKTVKKNPIPIDMSAGDFGGSDLRFKVTSKPKHGKINVALNAVTTNPRIVYTPDKGYGGPDKFTYTAFDAGFEFPLVKPNAAVTLAVGADAGVAVGISGAPRKIYAGTGIKLRSKVVGSGSKVVRWSVNGIVGGNRKLGTVSKKGLYIAPVKPPKGGTVRIRATSVLSSRRFDQVKIKILKSPKRLPILGTRTAAFRGTFGAKLWNLRKQVHVATLARTPGVVSVTITNGSRTVRTCKAQVNGTQTYVCIADKQRLPSSGFHAVATFKPTKGKFIRRSL